MDQEKTSDVSPILWFMTALVVVAFMFGYKAGKDRALKQNVQDLQTFVQFETLDK